MPQSGFVYSRDHLHRQLFNPFVWLIKQLILENHEYIADQQVIRKYKISGYLELLIQQSLKGVFSFTNYFSCSNLKKRTIMLTKKQSRKFQMINYIPAFLLAGMLFYLFSCKNMCEEPESPELQVFQIVENMPQFSVKLNEVMTTNTTSLQDEYGRREAWVEIANVSFSTYHIRMKAFLITRIKTHRTSGLH